MLVGDEMLIEFMHAIVIPSELREELLERPDGRVGSQGDGFDVLTPQVLHQPQQVRPEVPERRLVKTLAEQSGQLLQRRLQRGNLPGIHAPTSQGSSVAEEP